MNALAKAPTPPVPEPSLEAMLVGLTMYGKPSVRLGNDGWIGCEGARIRHLPPLGAISDTRRAKRCAR